MPESEKWHIFASFIQFWPWSRYIYVCVALLYRSPKIRRGWIKSCVALYCASERRQMRMCLICGSDSSGFISFPQLHNSDVNSPSLKQRASFILDGFGLYTRLPSKYSLSLSDVINKSSLSVQFPLCDIVNTLLWAFGYVFFSFWE